jgi:hypothetical protein
MEPAWCGIVTKSLIGVFVAITTSFAVITRREAVRTQRLGVFRAR